MSFRFMNPLKVAALSAAGLVGRPSCWLPSWACPCCDGNARRGVEFAPPPDVTNSAWDKKVKAVLRQAGF